MAEERALKELRELIEAYGKRLHKLRVRVALEGRDARPEDRIEIEDIERELENLKRKEQELRKAKVPLREDEVRQMAEARKVVEKKLEEPFEVRVAFSNRDDELGRIVGPFSKPFVIVNAPAGYGKSHLLREARRRLEQREGKWATIWIECRKDDVETTIMEQIARGLGYTEPVRTLADLAPIVGRALEYTMADGLIIFFDALDRWKKEPGPSPEWLSVSHFTKQKLLKGLSEIIVRRRKKLSGVFAGRYIGNWGEDFPLPYTELNLSPFDKEIIRVFILETMLRWQEITGSELEYSTEELERFAEEVLDVTGGHPGAIAEVLREVAEKARFDIILDSYFAPENKGGLFEEFVSVKIRDLLKGVSLSLQEVFQVVSIFRGFNENTLSALLDTGYLHPRDKDGWELYQEMLKTHLIEPDQPLSHDKILRRVLSARMRFEEPDRYRAIHSFAAELYDRWLQGRDHLGQPVPGGVPSGFDQIRLMIEGFYHLCQATEGEADRAEKVLSQLETHLRQLRYPLGRGTYALRREIERDEQLPGLLKRALGQKDYCAFLACIERFGEGGEQ